MTAAVQFPVADLVEDFSLYPRCGISEHHVMEIVHAIEGGFTPPPVIACRRTRRMVEGYHRRRAYEKLGIRKIPVEFRTYHDDAEHWHDAIVLQPNALNFTPRDQLRIMQVSMEKFRLSEDQLAVMMRTSVRHLRRIKPRYATVQEAAAKSAELRRKTAPAAGAGRAGAPRPQKFPLKNSVRHLSGKTISRKQAEAVDRAPGNPYLLLVNQLIDGLDNGLVPGTDKNPRLWERMEELAQAITAGIESQNLAS